MRRTIGKPIVAILGWTIALGMSMASMGADLATINKLIRRSETAESKYHESQQAYAEIRDDNTHGRMQAAERSYDERSRELDNARVATLAEFSGLTAQDIERLREDAVSWEATAREIGVHPSIIGIELIDARPPPFGGSGP